MFDEITIRRSTHGAGLDLGALAESILFYGKVNLLLNRGSLRQMLDACGPEVLLRLVEDGYVNSGYCYWNAAVYTEHFGTPNAQHRPTVFTVGHNPEQELRDIWDQALGRSGRTRRLRTRFMNASPQIAQPMLAGSAAVDVFGDEWYVEQAARAVLNSLAPGRRLPTGFYFRLIPRGEMVAVETNVDFGKVSPLLGPDGVPIQLSPASVLTEIEEVVVDLDLSSRLNSDVFASELSGQLTRLRTGSALTHAANEADLAQFSELFLDGQSIRDAINSGQRAFEEIFPVLDRSRAFRDWLARETVDVTLVKAYLDESTRTTWAERLPTRVLRWAIGIVVGLHVPVPALATMSAFDSVLLERISHGWRPSQFIDGQVRPFVCDI